MNGNWRRTTKVNAFKGNLGRDCCVAEHLVQGSVLMTWNTQFNKPLQSKNQQTVT